VPVVLIVDDQEWRARSLESVLGPAGFAVVKAYTSRQCADLAARVAPDLVITDFRLPDGSGADVSRQLRASAAAGTGSPCMILSADPLSRTERLACLEAGAWDIATTPIDPDELLLKARTFVQVKRACDAATERGLLDPETGCYNLNGLITRLGELASDAARWRRPMACVVMGLEPTAAGRLGDVVKRLRSVLRSSDALGRLSETELAVVATGTDDPGAQTLARRMGTVLGRDPARMGVYAVPANDSSGIRDAPEEVLSRAIQALRNAQRTKNGGGRSGGILL
jgi:PleD family two-component response regulator